MTPRPAMLQWVPARAALYGAGAAVGAAVAGVGLPQIAVAQVSAVRAAPAPVTPAQVEAIDTSLVESLIADLAAGNRQAALGRISSVDTIFFGQPMLVSNRGQFVDLLLGCTGAITGRRPLGNRARIEVEWQCPAGMISAELISGTGPYLQVSSIADQAERDRRASLPVRSAPPPIRTVATIPPPAPPAVRTPEQIAAAEVRERLAATERAELLNALGAAVQAGSLDGLGDRLNSTARFTYGYRDPFNSVNVDDLQGRGLAAGNEAVAAAIAQLGTPTGFACEQDRINVCRWTFADSHRGLLALVFQNQGRISTVQFIYVTPEAMALAAQNATPEQIEAYLASQQAGGAK